METLSIINYALLALTTVWTLFILYNIQLNCKQQCNLDVVKKCIATYIFGLVLIFMLYLAHRWVLLG